MRRYLLSIVVTALSAIPFVLNNPYKDHLRVETMAADNHAIVYPQSREVHEIDIVPIKITPIAAPIVIADYHDIGVIDSIPVRDAVVSSYVPPSDHSAMMKAAGILPRDYQYADYIISHESSWNSNSRNASSGAYGLCQAFPASKMASAGDDYTNNAITQLKWCDDYASYTYGGWYKAYLFWSAKRWW